MIVPKFRGLSSNTLFNTWGSTVTTEGNVKFEEDIKLLLETPLGSVLGNLTFGSNLYRLLYLQVNDALGTKIQEEIKKRIEDNYHDIIVTSVDVTFNKRDVAVKIGLNNSNSNVLTYIDLTFDKEVA